MIRKAAISVVLMTAVALPAMAAPPLAPGRPAGSRNAALMSQPTMFVGAALLIGGRGPLSGGR